MYGPRDQDATVSYECNEPRTKSRFRRGDSEVVIMEVKRSSGVVKSTPRRLNRRDLGNEDEEEVSLTTSSLNGDSEKILRG